LPNKVTKVYILPEPADSFYEGLKRVLRTIDLPHPFPRTNVPDDRKLPRMLSDCDAQLKLILWRPHGFFHREPLDLAHLGVPHAPVEIGTMLTVAARALAV